MKHQYNEEDLSGGRRLHGQSGDWEGDGERDGEIEIDREREMYRSVGKRGRAEIPTGSVQLLFNQAGYN